MSGTEAVEGRAIDLFDHLPGIYRARRSDEDPFSLLVDAASAGYADGSTAGARWSATPTRTWRTRSASRARTSRRCWKAGAARRYGC